MKSENLRKAIGGVDDDLIEAAKKPETKTKKNILAIVMPIAAAAAVVLAATFTIPGIIKSNQSGTDSEGGQHEYVFEKGYTYRVDSGKFASYEKGKVINDSYVGEKLDDVTVTAGWIDKDGKQLTEEHARAEIFKINDVSEDTAVAIRFLDELEAQVKDVYYVIMNPEADLTPVQPYVIVPENPANQDGNEATPE